jgi:acetylglutamate kinase
MKDVTVVRYGGSTFKAGDTIIPDIVSLQKQGMALIVVHGGGAAVTDWLKRLGMETRFVRGERVTDLPTLQVATAILAGLANKEITAAINLKGGRVVGISGVDGSLIESRTKDEAMGYVGAVEKINPGVLTVLLEGGFIPVVSSISLHTSGRADNDPGFININGDPAAGDIAAAIKAKKIVFLTDVPGVSDREGKIITHLSADEAKNMITSGVIGGGMIPKIEACLRALKAGATARIIDGRRPHALLGEMTGAGGGTTILL